MGWKGNMSSNTCLVPLGGGEMRGALGSEGGERSRFPSLMVDALMRASTWLGCD